MDDIPRGNFMERDPDIDVYEIEAHPWIIFVGIFIVFLMVIDWALHERV